MPKVPAPPIEHENHAAATAVTPMIMTALETRTRRQPSQVATGTAELRRKLYQNLRTEFDDLHWGSLAEREITAEKICCNFAFSAISKL